LPIVPSHTTWRFSSTPRLLPIISFGGISLS
jgi:hypothetical protein